MIAEWKILVISLHSESYLIFACLSLWWKNVGITILPGSVLRQKMCGFWHRSQHGVIVWLQYFSGVLNWGCEIHKEIQCKRFLKSQSIIFHNSLRMTDYIVCIFPVCFLLIDYYAIWNKFSYSKKNESIFKIKIHPKLY